MKTKKNRENKIHTGFRLSRSSTLMLEEMGVTLGLNKTNVVDMILKLVGNEKKLFINMIRKALENK